jgi:hypothetical protein
MPYTPTNFPFIPGTNKLKLVKEMDGGVALRTTMAFVWIMFGRTTIISSQNIRPQRRDLNSRPPD